MSREGDSKQTCYYTDIFVKFVYVLQDIVFKRFLKTIWTKCMKLIVARGGYPRYVL